MQFSEWGGCPVTVHTLFKHLLILPYITIAVFSTAMYNFSISAEQFFRSATMKKIKQECELYEI